MNVTTVYELFSVIMQEKDDASKRHVSILFFQN